VDRDRRILDAAAAVFYERGFHGAGMDELGARAGVSGPAIYRHFDGKNDVLAALFNEAIDELTGATAPVHDDPFADLERLIRHHVAFAVTQRHLVNIYQREDRALVNPWKRRFDRRRQHYVRDWEAAVTRCHPTADATSIVTATQATLGMIFSIAFWPPKLARAETTPQIVVELVLGGLSGLTAD
jgi:AcrR family transcriptional regulator